MPITALDPKTALVVIDLQKGIVGFPTAHPAGDVIANAAKMAKAFRSRELPVALVNVAGMAPGRAEQSMTGFKPPPNWTEIVPELDQQPTDILATKYAWGAFYGTGLDMHLRRRGVTQIVLCGIATSIGVESTARAASEHGYNVTFVTDAMTDMVAEAHESSIRRIFPRLGELCTTAELLAKLG
jgi:nicotinamidase-related amidase